MKFLQCGKFALFAILPLASPWSALGQQVSWRPSSLRIERITNRAGVVTINGNPVQAGASGLPGEAVASLRTKAEVLFPNTLQAVMLDGTKIVLDNDCIRLAKASESSLPRVLVSGISSVCLGDKGKRVNAKSTVVVEQDVNGLYTVAVLAGTAETSTTGPSVDEGFNIIKRFPSLNPSIGFGGGGYGNAYPSSGGLVIGSVESFIPISQHRARSILYSYSAIGSNFDGYTGVTTEIGKRWLTSSNRSTTSIYLGYSGFDSPGCFSNLINVGGGWERSGWVFGVSSGFNTGGCEGAFSFGALNISAPIAKIDPVRSVQLSLAPYLIWGHDAINVFSDNNNSGSGTNVSPGGKLTVVAPLTQAISVSTYSSIDTVYGVTVGGLFRYRFPVGNDFIRDPNLIAEAAIAKQAKNAQAASNRDNVVLINESHKATFSPEGEIVGDVVKMNADEMIAYIKSYLNDVSPLAEGNRVAQVAAENGALTQSTAAILGVEFLEVATLPASQSVQQPFDIDLFPTAPYVCASTPEGKAYGEQKLRDENKMSLADEVAAANRVYLGSGDLVDSPSWQVWQSGSGDTITNGWPITTSLAKAYRFANPATCRTINTDIKNDRQYTGPSTPVETIIPN